MNTKPANNPVSSTPNRANIGVEKKGAPKKSEIDRLRVKAKAMIALGHEILNGLQELKAE